jgi:DNA mismatch repair ATPase MutS
MDGLGHPLIEPERVVLNDLHLGPQSPIAIITGSNMSGKSTLLKSVGMNLVLAGMGGPVEARAMRWTPLALSSDINVRDSLDDGKSYFAVEVERVERILRLAREGGKVLGIFDELFRGTNSAERLAIAMALIAHLRGTGGLYLVATHDLAITRLAEEIPGIVNFHFREEVHDGTMRFDYRLRPGPAPTRNAIRVLETRGYPETLVREARARLQSIEGKEP